MGDSFYTIILRQRLHISRSNRWVISFKRTTTKRSQNNDLTHFVRLSPLHTVWDVANETLKASVIHTFQPGMPGILQVAEASPVAEWGNCETRQHTHVLRDARGLSGDRPAPGIHGALLGHLASDRFVSFFNTERWPSLGSTLRVEVNPPIGFVQFYQLT